MKRNCNSAHLRFWAYWQRGYVRLTLAPNQTLHAAHVEDTDEGWSGEYRQWHWDPNTDMVTMEVTNDGRDCDGRLTTSTMYHCPAALIVKAQEEDQKILPWERTDSEVYDEYAQAAGY